MGAQQTGAAGLGVQWMSKGSLRSDHNAGWKTDLQLSIALPKYIHHKAHKEHEGIQFTCRQHFLPRVCMGNEVPSRVLASQGDAGPYSL